MAIERFYSKQAWQHTWMFQVGVAGLKVDPSMRRWSMHERLSDRCPAVAHAARVLGLRSARRRHRFFLEMSGFDHGYPVKSWVDALKPSSAAR
jgi:hypothetical protein